MSLCFFLRPSNPFSTQFLSFLFEHQVLQLVTLGIMMQLVTLGIMMQLVILGIMMQLVNFGILMQLVNFGILMQLVTLGIMMLPKSKLVAVSLFLCYFSIDNCVVCFQNVPYLFFISLHF